MLSRQGTRTRGRLRAAAGAALAVSLVGAALAPAAGPASSRLTVLDAGAQDGAYLTIGTVKSAERACVPNRKVRFIVKRTGGGSELLDVARTSDRGAWFSTVPESDYSDGGVAGTTYKLAPRKVKQGGTKIRCGGDRFSPA